MKESICHESCRKLVIKENGEMYHWHNMKYKHSWCPNCGLIAHSTYIRSRNKRKSLNPMY